MDVLLPLQRLFTSPVPTSMVTGAPPPVPRHSRLLKLSERLVLCTVSDAEPGAGVLTAQVVRALSPCQWLLVAVNHQQSLVRAAAAVDVPVIEAACPATYRCVDAIRTIAQSVRSWLEAATGQSQTCSQQQQQLVRPEQAVVAVLHCPGELAPLLAACILVEVQDMTPPQVQSTLLKVMRAVAASAASNSSIYRVLPSLVEFVGAYGSLRRVKPFDDRTLAVWFKRITLQSLPRCVYGETTTPLPVYECRLFFMILEDGEVVYNSLVGEPGVRVVPWSLQKQTHFVLNDDADRRRVVLRRGFSIVFYHQRALGPPSRLFEIPWHASFFQSLKEPTWKLKRSQLDHANVDPRFDDNFQIEFEFELLTVCAAPSPPSHSRAATASHGNDVRRTSNTSVDDQLFLQVRHSSSVKHVVGMHPLRIGMLPVTAYTSIIVDNGGHASSCQICRCEFELGDSLRRLPCMHPFHTDCVTPWLGSKGVCPTCLLLVDDFFDHSFSSY